MNAKLLIREAEYKESSYLSYFYNKLICTNEIFEEKLAELYLRAANLFYIEKEYNEASKAYIISAQYYNKINEYDQMISCYNKISNCYIGLNKHDKAITYMKKCSEYYFNIHKLTNALKYEIRIAEMYEQKFNIVEAINHYEKIITLSDNNSIYTIKIAELYIIDRKPFKAIEYYNNILENIKFDKLLKIKQCEIILKIILCYIANKNNNIINILDEYRKSYLLFNKSIECNFLIQFLKIIEERDINIYESELIKYSCMKKMDNILISLFTMIKEEIDD
jgi:tetratricopeptide (TPR) repeat protein